MTPQTAKDHARRDLPAYLEATRHPSDDFVTVYVHRKGAVAEMYSMRPCAAARFAWALLVASVRCLILRRK